MKKTGKKKIINTAYDKWLRKLVGERELFEELTEEEIYKIILKISEVRYVLNPVISNFFTYEDMANELYKNYLSRDWEKDLSNFSDIKTDEFPYYDEKSRKYFKSWRPRTEKKGFDRMKMQRLSIIHFSNLIYRETCNYISGYLRNKKFRDTLMESISLDIEPSETDTGIAFIEKVEDKKQTFVHTDYLSNDTLKVIEEDNQDIYVEENYSIQLDSETKTLSYGSLMELYQYLDPGRKVTTKEILEHIIYKGSNIISRENKRFIENFVTDFKKYLLEEGIVKTSIYTDGRGKERTRYAFEQLH